MKYSHGKTFISVLMFFLFVIGEGILQGLFFTAGFLLPDKLYLLPGITHSAATCRQLGKSQCCWAVPQECCAKARASSGLGALGEAGRAQGQWHRELIQPWLQL